VFLAQAGLPVDATVSDSPVSTAPSQSPSHTIPFIKQRRPGPENPRYGIPPADWPALLRRIEQSETLRQIAQSYGVSYETVRRTVKAARSKEKGDWR
jgi:Sigma-70, region 4